MDYFEQISLFRTYSDQGDFFHFNLGSVDIFRQKSKSAINFFGIVPPTSLLSLYLHPIDFKRIQNFLFMPPFPPSQPPPFWKKAQKRPKITSVP